MPQLHTLQIRVYYEDTDFSGVVYHANYLRFLERGRTELLRSRGIAGRALFEVAGAAPVAFVIHALEIRYRVPAFMDDLLTIETHVSEVKRASARMDQRVLRDGAVLVTAAVGIAMVSEGRPVRFSPAVRTAFEESL